mgnify:CR=1 FL=1
MSAFTFVFGFRKILIALGVLSVLSVGAGAMLGAGAERGSWQDELGTAMALPGVYALAAVIALYVAPALLFFCAEIVVAPLATLRRLARVQDTATSRLRSAAQGLVELELTPVDETGRAALGLRQPDYFGAFQADGRPLFVLYGDAVGMHVKTGDQFGGGPVLASGLLRTVAVDAPLDLRRRPFGLSMRLARKLFDSNSPAEELAAIEACYDRLTAAAAAQGRQSIDLLTADPATGRGVELFAAGQAGALRELQGLGRRELLAALVLAAILWFALIRHLV